MDRYCISIENCVWLLLSRKGPINEIRLFSSLGPGPFGAVFAHEAHKRSKSVLVIDRRNHIAGNLYCENKDNINIHVYGAHIFHTSLKHVWDYVNQFAEFNHYVNSPVANYKR